MTDLEELWDDYPSGEPPIADLLRRARAEARARRRRYVVRPLLAGVSAAAVASAFVIGTQHGGTPTAPSADSGTAGAGGAMASLVAPELRHSAFQADLQPADSCGQLLASYQKRALAEVGPYGWPYVGWEAYASHRTAMVQGMVPQLGKNLASVAGTASVPQKAADAIDGVADSGTGTNVQEVGVDEPDRVKTNGSLLVRAGQHDIKVYDVSGAEVRHTATLDLPDLQSPQLLLDGTTLIVLGANALSGNGSRLSGRFDGGTWVDSISLADPGHPAITARTRYSGTLDAARMTGSDVHLVLGDGLPGLKFVSPHRGLSRKQALERNREIVKASTLDDWLPRYDDGSGSRPLLDCDRVALPPDGVALGTESVVGFDAATPTEPDAMGIAGQTSIAYESTDHLYLTTSPAYACIECRGGALLGGGQSFVVPGDRDRGTTIFQLDLSGTSATHVATGRVDGTIASSWSMDEADGVLRIAITHRAPGDNGRVVSQSAVVTMRPEGTKLTEIGRLDGLGANETLTAARWFDNLAILSTARQIDPLFTIDLTDPTHPTQLGALHIPGFSSYFHPLGNGLLLGIGQKVSFEGRSEQQQAQVGLFDISDLTDVKQVAVDALHQWTWPYAGEDPHAFSWLPDRSTALTSFRTRNGRTLLGEYHVDGSTLTQKLIPLEGHRYGMTVRTMELPNGKIVLMAGGRVSFLDL